jgi:serine/threonine protein kinase, bacterial
LAGGGDTTQVPGPEQVFGRYRLLSLLGEGGMGQVWRAHDSQTNRVVALKVLPARSADDQEMRERFRRECRAVALLSEPHVIPIHDFGDIDGRLYLNMRLVEGTDLRTLIRCEGPLAPRRAVAIITQVAAALQAAHDAGLVHRDVKPSNILLGADDFTYLIDFGIAHVAGEHSLTQAGDTIGTFAYLAPEAVGAAVKTDARVDVYALACVLYECVAGRPPFSSTTGIPGLISEHLHTPPPRPSIDRPEIPAAFDAVIAKGMAKDPTERYQTARELAAATHAALTGDPAVGQQTIIDRPAPVRRRRRIRLSRNATALAAAVAAVVVGLGIFVFLPSRPSPPPSPPSPRPPAPRQTVLPFTGLDEPEDVAVDTAGDVYVTDTSNNRVVKLAAGSDTPAVLLFTGLKVPIGVAADTVGNVYVADATFGNGRVVKLAAGSSVQTVLPFTGLSGPSGVAVDTAGSVYVADTGHNRVVKLVAGSSTQTELPFTGLKYSAGGMTHTAAGAAVDTAGNVYVSDYFNNRVVKLAAGSTTQTLLPFTGLSGPSGVAVDTAGNVFVADTDNKRVVKLPAG